jgi:hypothetical protein
VLEQTKERPIKNIKMQMTGPTDKEVQAIAALGALGFTETSDSMPWQDAFSDQSHGEFTDKQF